MDDQSDIGAAEAAVTAALEPPPSTSLLATAQSQPPPLPNCENCGADGWTFLRTMRPACDRLPPLLSPRHRRCSRFFPELGLEVLRNDHSWLMARPWHLTNQIPGRSRASLCASVASLSARQLLFFFVVNYWAKSIHADPSKLSAEDRADIAADLNDPDIPPTVKARVRRPLDAKGPTQPKAQTSPSRNRSHTATLGERFAVSVGYVTVSVRQLGPLVQFDKPPPTHSRNGWSSGPKKKWASTAARWPSSSQRCSAISPT